MFQETDGKPVSLDNQILAPALACRLFLGGFLRRLFLCRFGRFTRGFFGWFLLRSLFHRFLFRGWFLGRGFFRGRLGSASAASSWGRGRCDWLRLRLTYHGDFGF